MLWYIAQPLEDIGDASEIRIKHKSSKIVRAYPLLFCFVLLCFLRSYLTICIENWGGGGGGGGGGGYDCRDMWKAKEVFFD